MRGLLVVRDGFVAASLMIVISMLLGLVLSDEQIDAAAPQIVRFFPLVIALSVAVVMLVSATARRTAAGSHAAAYVAFFELLGTLAGSVVLLVLVKLGAIGAIGGSLWLTVLAIFIGSLGAIAVAYLVNSLR